MLVNHHVALASLLRPHEDGWGAAVRARYLPRPGLPRSPVGALRQAVEVGAGLAEALPRVGQLPRQALQEGAPLLPVLQELLNPPQKPPAVARRRQVPDPVLLRVRDHLAKI